MPQACKAGLRDWLDFERFDSGGTRKINEEK